MSSLKENYLVNKFVLIACGRQQSQQRYIYDVEIKLYGMKCVVPVLVVPGHSDVIMLAHFMKDDAY